MFLSGVNEGFYGAAWSAEQRVEMFGWIEGSGMNTFIYGPKDDIKIRARWRELYDAKELAAIVHLAEAAAARGLTFMVAIAPCLDVTYSSPADLATLNARLDQLLAAGIRHFALLFDDISGAMAKADQVAFGSLALAQCHFSNAAFDHIRQSAPDSIVLFCPTEYCAAFASHDVSGSAYLNDLGKTLHPDMQIFWTGPDIVSETIDAESLREVGRVLRRKPVLWENFHANDYDIRRIYSGPLSGRSDDILPLINGIITNPNNEFEANFVPVHTTGAFVRGNYDPVAAFEAALVAWQPRFRLASSDALMPIAEIRLLAEIEYQPFACGPEVEKLLQVARQLLSQNRPDTTDPQWIAGLAAIRGLRDRIRTLFDHMTELDNRDLFYCFHQYLWEAREETTHLVTYLDWLAENPAAGEVFPSDQRIHNFYRRGYTVAVQELLPRDANGHYSHGA